MGLSEEELKEGSAARTFGGTFVPTLVMAVNLATFLGDGSDLTWGLTAGALAGIDWVAAAFGVVYLFERRSLKLFLINAGYMAVSFVVMGGILGAWG